MKEINDKKTIYLIRTLSRTRRKDYENYVINAIWHKLSNPNIEVVSQQFVKDVVQKTGRSHYFIDLYFPALNIGIECNEAYHKNQPVNDKERELTIFDVLYAIKADKYEPITIDVTQGFEDLQKSIDNAVETIRHKIHEKKPLPWVIETTADYFKGRDRISIDDKVGFKTIRNACNVLFKTGYDEFSGGTSKAGFTPWTFSNTELKDYGVWFPKLAIEIKNENGDIETLAASKGWHNTLKILDDGSCMIIERNERKTKVSINDNKKRIVFVKYKDPLGYNEYKFVGIFEEQKTSKANKNERYFKRIGEEIALIK